METWRPDTLWLDVAFFVLLMLVGHILLGHFEDFKPRWRRVLKVVLGAALFVTLLSVLGRFWAWVAVLVPIVVGGAIVHGWWLPRHGINGWTGEPRQKYLELVGARTKSADWRTPPRPP
jgi:xanthine/uracil permease